MTPPSPFLWLPEMRVRFRSGAPGGTWRVVSQYGPDVVVKRDSERGCVTRVADWSELVEERHAAAGRAEAAKHVRVARPLARPAALEVDSERGEL